MGVQNDAKIGIIGASGTMGQKRIQALLYLYGPEYCERNLVICDSNTQPLHDLDMNISIEPSAQKVIEDETITAIILSTPNGEKRDKILLDALNNGKHVLVEKPLTIDLETLEKSFDLAIKKDISLQAAYNLDYFPGIRKIKNELNRIGEINFIQAFYANGWFNPQNDVQSWILSKSAKAGVEFYMGCHMISLLRMLIGDQKLLKREIITKKSFNKNYPDSAIISLELENMIFSATVSYVYWKNDLQLYVAGSEGVATLSGSVKYIKYGQEGEKVSISERQVGIPKTDELIFDYGNVNKKSVELEYLDVEIMEWVENIRKGEFDNVSEYNKNVFIHKCLSTEYRI